jgi:hypothetical protein
VSVWSDVIEQTEGTWTEGHLVIAQVECRERGDRLGLSVRRAAAYTSGQGSVVGFDPAQWQVEPARARPRRAPEPAVQPPRDARTPAPPPQPAPKAPDPAAVPVTAEATRPGNQAPVSGDAARLVVTIYETEDVVADQALLKAVAGMLRDHPGRDEVRLVVHDADGQDNEFDLPRAEVTDDLTRSIRAVLRQNGSVRVTTSGRAA